MADPVLSTTASKVGSNLKARKLLAATDAAILERRLKPLGHAERQRRRRLRAILTKPVLRAAADLARHHRDSYHQAFVNAGGNAAKIAQARKRTRAAFTRALRSSIPTFAEYEAVAERHQRQHQGFIANQLLAPQGLTLDLALGDILPPDGVDFQLFKPPFQLFDATSDSSAQPRAGIVVSDISILHFAPRFPNDGFNPARGGDSRASVGINFQMPRRGFLTGVATLQNLIARFRFAALDNFGFSSADLDAVHTIFVTIIRGRRVIRFERVMFADGLVARGDDLSLTRIPILDSTPFTIRFTVGRAFDAGERIQILAGAAVSTHLRTDDMDGFITATTAWQVKKLSLGISG